jgi:signal peptidase I
MENQKKSSWQSFWELARFALIAIIIVVPIRVFIAQPFIVSGSSMVPTFQDGQYLVIDEISYFAGTPKRDDVVVFRNPKNTKVFFIKRIIGLPGETVDVKGKDVFITNKEYPNGFKLDEPYVKNISDSDTHFPLSDNEYFVMGDNRPASSDSRYWGAVSKNLLIGRVFLRLLPVNEIGLFPGNYKQSEINN